MAVSSRPESEKTGEAISGARATHFPAAPAYRTPAAATNSRAARSSNCVRHSGDDRRNGQPRLALPIGLSGVAARCRWLVPPIDDPSWAIMGLWLVDPAIY